ncbi:histidine kinase dimerization/phospho-acceptor domain-containing protein [Natrinema sp. 1APR25-10V2]|uniref:histidine kinase dimerization/phospho-acceptor domain-containing protein n=1 Tax=Natrinema sp. 1APR25-10V2 TaxID=2951081 RepID=UPI0028766FD0|nr:histidine kinase dimerization/phospho-acceptor domain-containing protein [Natrinema sp. 1APR25-10V2]MDS0474681.1 hypothetical protein [Natrinema sp. 1APR25-10V2]
MVSHDLRNPLAVASGELEQYRATGDDTCLDGIEDSLERLEELIVDLTALARSTTPAQEHQSVSLSAVAQDAWDGIETRSASIETRGSTLLGDRSQLRHFLKICFETRSVMVARM